MNIQDLIVIFFVVFVFPVISAWFWSRYHEQIHKEIYEQRGYKAKVSYNLCECKIKDKDYKDMALSHDLNEIISYNIQTLYWLVYFFIAFFIIGFIIWA